MITIITSNDKTLLDFKFCPFISDIKFDIQDLNEGLYIIDGWELANSFYKAASYNNPKIQENIYWFFSKKELDEQYEIKFNYFLANDILNSLCNNTSSIVLYDFNAQKNLLLNDYKKLVYFDNKIMNITIYLIEIKKFISINLRVFSFISDTNINNLEDLLDYLCNSQGYSYDECKKIKLSFIDNKKIDLILKEQGFLNKYYRSKYYFDSFNFNDNLQFDIKNYNTKLYLFFIAATITPYIDLPISVEVRNLFRMEEYFNNIEITTIKNKYENLYFKDEEKVKYIYNCTDSVSGRMYPTNVNDNSSLQTLQREQRDILLAAEDCTLYDFDYSAFEFEILLNILGYSSEDKDYHTDIINYLFEQFKHKFKEDYDIVFTRDFGKKINYAIVFGSKIENLYTNVILPELLIYFEEEYLEEIFDAEKMIDKLYDYELIGRIQTFIINELDKKYDSERRLLRNHFNRFIEVEKEYAILNNYIQSTASDFLYKKIIKIIKLLDGEKNKILLQNHDSILIQLENKLVKDTDVLDNIYEILESMEGNLFGRVKLKYGINWKDLQEFN